jgi:Poly(R)-hydroxyalkanoic acid synthase subunit (PHA_synth_III_E)
MTASGSNQGSRAAYDFWLGLISKFLGPVGEALPAGATSSVPEGLPFPVDQVAKAAMLTQQLLQGMGQVLAPALQAGVPNLLAQWAKPLAAFTPTDPGDATTANPQAMFAPWLAFMSNVAASLPAASAFTPSAGVPPQAPLQSVSQAWADMASRFTGSSPVQAGTNFDRAYGALSDGVGLGPTRKLYAAWRDVMSASVAQQDARTHYTGLLQSAYAQGFQRLLIALAAKADAGERVDSVLALIRLWTIDTEQAVHETLQSEPGLAATAALIRSDLAYRKKMQQVAAVLADQYDMASRHELDEAFREIQALKRELRATQTAGDERPPTVKRPLVRKTGAAKKSGRAGVKKSENG